jgi:hypothetical protein
MKRFFLTISIILLPSSIYGQSWAASLTKYIQAYPQYMLVEHPFTGAKALNILTSADAVTIIRNGDTTNAQYQNSLKYLTGNSFYSFFANKKLYMLSYDTCSTCFREPSLKNPIERGLYLFRLDKDKWSKVCFEPIEIGYYSLDSSIDKPNIPQHNVWSTFSYFPRRNVDDRPEFKNTFAKGVIDGSVTLSANGDVTIVLVNYKRYYNDKYTAKESFENKTFVLTPNTDGTYKIR